MNPQTNTATPRPAPNQLAPATANNRGFYDVLAQLVRQHKRQRSAR